MSDLQTSAIDPEALDLRKQFEHLYLRRLVKEMKNEELPLDDVLKCGRAYCDLLKRDAAHERNAVAREKNSIAYEKNTIAREKNDITREKNELARLAATRSAATRKGARSPSDRSNSSDPYDDDAPWGRKDDGTPYTHAEFLTALDDAVKDIYGIPNFCSTVPDPPPIHRTARSRTDLTPPAASPSSDDGPASHRACDAPPTLEARTGSALVAGVTCSAGSG